MDEEKVLEQLKELTNLEKTKLATERSIEILNKADKLLNDYVLINEKDESSAESIQVLISAALMLTERQLDKVKIEEWKKRHARERAGRSYISWKEERKNEEKGINIEETFIKMSEQLYYLLAINQEITNLIAWIDHLNKKDI